MLRLSYILLELTRLNAEHRARARNSRYARNSINSIELSFLKSNNFKLALTILYIK